MLWVPAESNASFKLTWGQGSLGSDSRGDERGPLPLQDVGPQGRLLGPPPRFCLLVEHGQKPEQASAQAL